MRRLYETAGDTDAARARAVLWTVAVMPIMFLLMPVTAHLSPRHQTLADRLAGVIIVTERR